MTDHGNRFCSPTRTFAWVVLGVWGFSALLLVCLLSYHGLLAPFWWLGVVFGIGTLICIIELLRPRAHEGISLLWCRRFGNRDQWAGARNRWMWGIVTEAGRNLAVPFTLTDQAIKGSQDIGRVVSGYLRVGFQVTGVLLLMIAWIRIIVLIENRWMIAIAFLVFVFILSVVQGASAIYAELMADEFSAYDGDPSQVIQLVNTMTQDRYVRRDMVAIRCNDDEWREVVVAMLEAVDLAIIDDSEISENVKWETQEARRRLGDDRVLIVRPSLVNDAGDGCCEIIKFDLANALDAISVLSPEKDEEQYVKEASLDSYSEKLAADIRNWVNAQSSEILDRRRKARDAHESQSGSLR